MGRLKRAGQRAGRWLGEVSAEGRESAWAMGVDPSSAQVLYSRRMPVRFADTDKVVAFLEAIAVDAKHVRIEVHANGGSWSGPESLRAFVERMATGEAVTVLRVRASRRDNHQGAEWLDDWSLEMYSKEWIKDPAYGPVVASVSGNRTPEATNRVRELLDRHTVPLRWWQQKVLFGPDGAKEASRRRYETRLMWKSAVAGGTVGFVLSLLVQALAG